jgi:hypothetical protein
LRHYSLEFGIDFRVEEGASVLRVTHPVRIYIHWNCDIICPLGLTERLCFAKFAELQPIPQRVAITPLQVDFYSSSVIIKIRRNLRKFMLYPPFWDYVPPYGREKQMSVNFVRLNEHNMDTELWRRSWGKSMKSYRLTEKKSLEAAIDEQRKVPGWQDWHPTVRLMLMKAHKIRLKARVSC